MFVWCCLLKAGSNLITPTLPINLVISLDPHVLNIQKASSIEMIDIKPATGHTFDKPLNIRILSSEVRQGMVIYN